MSKLKFHLLHNQFHLTSFSPIHSFVHEKTHYIIASILSVAMVFIVLLKWNILIVNITIILLIFYIFINEFLQYLVEFQRYNKHSHSSILQCNDIDSL